MGKDERDLFSELAAKALFPLPMAGPASFPLLGAEPCPFPQPSARSSARTGRSCRGSGDTSTFLSTSSALSSLPESFQEQVGGSSQSPQDL